MLNTFRRWGVSTRTEYLTKIGLKKYAKSSSDEVAENLDI